MSAVQSFIFSTLCIETDMSQTEKYVVKADKATLSGVLVDNTQYKGSSHTVYKIRTWQP